MAHFAKIDENNLVTEVIVVANAECLDADGNESEAVGAGFCAKLCGGIWKQTSYNDNIRKNYAGVGYTYREDIDAFVPPQPYASWVLNETTAQWEAPVAMPDDAGTGDPPKSYYWDEPTTNWIEVTND